MRAAYGSIVNVATLDQCLTLGVGSGVIGDFDAGGQSHGAHRVRRGCG